jgi:hypothetical protein
MSALVDIVPDALIAAGGYVNREYGATGYRIEAIECYGPVTAFRVRCSDGGRFFVVADRWGNCESVTCREYRDEQFDNAELLAVVADMIRKAVAP